MDWKDLEIDNIPSDFFVSERYEIISETLNDSEMAIRRQPNNRINIIVDLKADYRYKYRLKPLEPIRIDQNVLGIIIDYYECQEFRDITNDMEFITEKLGRPVEIIEE